MVTGGTPMTQETSIWLTPSATTLQSPGFGDLPLDRLFSDAPEPVRPSWPTGGGKEGLKARKIRQRCDFVWFNKVRINISLMVNEGDLRWSHAILCACDEFRYTQIETLFSCIRLTVLTDSSACSFGDSYSANINHGLKPVKTAEVHGLTPGCRRPPKGRFLGEWYACSCWLLATKNQSLRRQLENLNRYMAWQLGRLEKVRQGGPSRT